MSGVAQRALLRALPWVWRVPGVAERVAARLFLTPLGKPKPRELRPPQAVGEVLHLRARRPFTATRYGTGQPVLLVHGWGGRGAQMNGFVDELVERGYAAVTLDLPAHGASSGARTHAIESSEALLALCRAVGAPRGVIAHSYGAAATCLAAGRGMPSEAFVFIAPLPSLDVAVEQFASRAVLPALVAERAARLIETQLGIERSTTDLARLGAALRVPLLLVHDRSDRIIAHAHSEKIAESWPQGRLWSTEGLGHQRILRDADVVARAVSFLEQGTHRRDSDLSELLTFRSE